MELSHCVTVECAVPAARAYAFMMDGEKLGRWAIGAFGTAVRPDGIFVGTSLFDGSVVYGRAVGDLERMVIDYHVGSAPEEMTPRIMAKIVPGPRLGRPPDTCLVTLLAWRDASMDEARWHRLKVSHEAEIILIQSQISRGAD